MTTIKTSTLELSKLAIDRTKQPKKTGLPLNLLGIVIVILLGSSLLFVGQNIFYPQLSFDAKSNVEASVNVSNKLVNQSIPQPNLASQGTKLTAKNLLSEQENQTVLDASGYVVARRIATVSSQVTGKLSLLKIEEGQRVSKSEILAELDDKQASITHQLAVAELSAKHASYDEFILLLQQHSLRFKRNQSLAEQKLISQQQLEDSEFRNSQLVIQIRNKKALMHLAKQRVELAQYQLNQHKIRAPFDGVVISKNAQVGELISAGSSGGGFIRTGVATIVDMSSLEIEVEVGESYINRVFAGQKVIAKLDAYPQWQIDSEVVAVIPTANRQKASIKVRVKLLAIDSRILPDMGVKVSFKKAPDHLNAQVAVASL